jgi:hypothetical protein
MRFSIFSAQQTTLLYRFTNRLAQLRTGIEMTTRMFSFKKTYGPFALHESCLKCTYVFL